MKKICLVDFDMSVRGGVEQVTASLSEALSDFYEVHVVSLCLNAEPAYTLHPGVKFKVMLPREERLRDMRKKLKPMLVDYFRENGIDVAFAQGNYPGFLLSAVRGRTKTKLVFCDHGALMNQWHQRDIVLIRGLASHLCHRTVTLTEQSREDYHKKLLVSRKKLSCIRNWIEPSRFRSPGYRTDSRRIISAGRFGREKGFDMLVEVFAKVVQKHPDWHLDLYGDGEMAPQIRHRVEQLGLSDNLHLPGICRDLPDRYGDYALYVLPSYREGLPLVLLEAKASRLPIVAFDITTGPREIVRDQVDGLLIPPYDKEQMAEAICRLIENPDLREEMSRNSRENLSKFNKKMILGQWRDLIESLS